MSENKIVNLNGDKDPDLEALYRQADKPVPPVRLDAMIKQAAREHKPGRKTDSYRWFAGIAASVIVGVLFLQLYPGSLMHEPVMYEQKQDRVTSSARLTERFKKESEARQKRETQGVKRSVAQYDFYSAPTSQDLSLTETDMPSAPADGIKENSGKAGASAAILASKVAEFEIRTEAVSAADRASLDEDTTPEGYLKRIRQHIKKGELEKAREATKELQQKYPNYKLEANIVEKLGLP